MSEPVLDAAPLGTIRPALAGSLGSHLNLGAAEGTASTLVIDGSSTGDAEPVREAAESGKVVVVVSPSEAQVTALAALTGTRVSADTPAVAIVRGGAGGHVLGALPAVGRTMPDSVSDDPAGADGPSGDAPPLSLGAGVAQLVRGLAPGQLKGTTSLLGPDGAYCGASILHMPFAARISCVGDNCKPPYAGRCQSLSTTAENVFHVFWNDGASPPHYVVILRQRLYFGTGGMHTDLPGARGYGMHGAVSEVRDVSVSAGELRLVTTSPESTGVQAMVKEEMILTQDVQGGSAPQRTTVQEGTPLTLTEWTVNNRSTPGNAAAMWDFSQADVVNGFNPWQDRFTDYWNVRRFPQITSSGLTATTYAVWHVMNAKETRLRGMLQLTQKFMWVANKDVWKSGNRGIDFIDVWGTLGFDIDLAQVAKTPR